MSFPIFTLLNYSFLNLNKNDFKILSIGSESINNCDYITIDFITLIFKGYVYNFQELVDIIQNKSLELNKKNKDYEIIIHLYQKYGIQYTLSLLQGSFSLILFDNNYYKDGCKMYVARDPFGIEPLYIYNTIENSSEQYQNENENQPKNSPTIFAFSSNLKQLSSFSNALNKLNCIKQFPPGHYNEYSVSYKVLSHWKEINSIKYYNLPIVNIIPKTICDDVRLNTNNALYTICNNLINVIQKQIIAKPSSRIGCLLSGGIDSSIIAAILNEYCITNSIILETFCIGFIGSNDLKYAKIVSEYLGTKHTEIIISENDYFFAIKHTIKILETYDTITIRSGITNYLINQWIIKNSKIQLLFTGDGADELMGGHLYLHMTNNSIDFDNNCKELLNNIHHYDTLRSSKTILNSNIQICMPFLDQIFVQNYLSIPLNIRYVDENKYNEKVLLRMAFSKQNSLNMHKQMWIPDEILWRTKEEFSDGLCPSNTKITNIITDFMNTINLDIKQCKKYRHNPPKTLEQLFYREIFEKCYPNLGNILPVMWMPQFIETSDPSPRSSGIYNEYIFWKNDNI